MPKGSVEGLLGVRPDTIVKELDAPHLVMQTNPVEAARAIREFVDGLGMA
jgi:hypothetical protein